MPKTDTFGLLADLAPTLIPNGLPANFDESCISYLSEQAKNGPCLGHQAAANRRLGIAYEEGQFGVEINKSKALAHYDKASAQGDRTALVRLAYDLENGFLGSEIDHEQSFRKFSFAANILHDPFALRRMRDVYENGDFGQEISKDTSRDYDKMAQEYSKKHGYSNALLVEGSVLSAPNLAKDNLGQPSQQPHAMNEATPADQSQERIEDPKHLYRQAVTLLDSNPRNAFFLMNQAAEQGNQMAMMHLAELYSTHGFQEQAENLYKKAADRGNRDAIDILGDRLYDSDDKEVQLFTGREAQRRALTWSGGLGL